LKDDLDEMNYSANRLWFEHAQKPDLIEAFVSCQKRLNKRSESKKTKRKDWEARQQLLEDDSPEEPIE